MALNKYGSLNGPIPGENLISDERNYPWHRPPDFDDLNDAMEYIIENLSEKPKLFSLINTLELGATAAELSQTIVMMDMMQGRYTLDYALLLAGPLTKFISIIADGYEIEYDLGVYEEYQYIPPQLLDAAAEDSEISLALSQKEKEETEDSENEEARAGLMQGMREMGDAAPEEEQAAMLGYNVEEEEA